MPIRFKYEIDWLQSVYLVTDPEQLPWLLTAIELNPNGPIFTVSRNGEAVALYEGEFTLEVDVVTKTK